MRLYSSSQPIQTLNLFSLVVKDVYILGEKNKQKKKPLPVKIEVISESKNKLCMNNAWTADAIISNVAQEDIILA